ncbi:4186_t:CDS:2, partial [Gigaspora margarita]
NILDKHNEKTNLIIIELLLNESNNELVNQDSSETDSQSPLLNVEPSQDKAKNYFDIKIEGEPKPIIVGDEPIDKIFEKIQKEFE